MIKRKRKREHDSCKGGDCSKVQDQITVNVQHIYATKDAFAALKADGGVVAWGEQSGSFGGSGGGNCTKVQAQLAGDVQHIYATDRAFAALKADGSVVSWGSDSLEAKTLKPTGPHPLGRVEKCFGHFRMFLDASIRFNCSHPVFICFGPTERRSKRWNPQDLTLSDHLEIDAEILGCFWGVSIWLIIVRTLNLFFRDVFRHNFQFDFCPLSCPLFQKCPCSD